MTFEKLTIWGWVGSSLRMLQHRLQKQHLPLPHSQGLEQTLPRCSSVPHPWNLQVEGVTPPANKFPNFSFFFFFLLVWSLTIKAAQYPKMTVMASFVADGH